MIVALAMAASSTGFAGECSKSCSGWKKDHHEAAWNHQDQHHVKTTPVAHHSESSPDIVDTAVAAGSFNTLVAAVQAAGLVDALKAEGPYTVFAPTDEAFAKIPASTIESLLKPENKAKLTAILTYHVVPARVTASEVVNRRSAKTLQGQEVAIGVAGDKVFVDNARVIKTDIETSNGVIHVIDTVLMPSE